MGAPRAGSPNGVAAFTGKYLDSWPGLKAPHGFDPGPYVDEQPLYVVTRDNLDEHAKWLTQGQKALLKAYPDEFRLRVFPSHRDFRRHDWVCDVVKFNARHAQLLKNGLAVSGQIGAHPFPFPKSGLEAIWNVMVPHRARSESVTYDIANVYASGQTAWGRAEFRTLQEGFSPHPQRRGRFDDTRVSAYFFIKFLSPDREKGQVAVGFQPNAFHQEATQAWQYLPGLRRVRKAPEVGFDYPVPPSGMHTSDDDTIFNGSPARYDWKLVGRGEFLVPYHNFGINDPALSYAEVLGKHSINPEHFRYELHRVWIIEGTLKEGLRHIYKRRTIYADEDSWLALWGDNYDGRDQLWRVSMVGYFMSQETASMHRGVSVYHDLTSGDYEATYLSNQAGDAWWRLGLPMQKRDFSPEAAARAGN